MSSLPEDINIDILMRVPVKSTFVCKCVCRNWFQLISDPDFVKMHLNHTRKSHCLLIQSANKYLRYDSLSSWNESDGTTSVVELDPPYKSSSRSQSTKLLGSCNGLVYGWNYLIEFFFLWNPATKEFKRLPKPDTSCDYIGRKHGFGYDYKTDDYKLVKIDYQKSTSVQVYSLKSNSWRTFQSVKYEFHWSQVSGLPVLFNGSLHWFGVAICKKSSTGIVRIGFSEETFEELQLPMTLQTTQYHMNMGVLEECLCVLVHIQTTLNIWIMKDYGVPDSWTKLYTITYESLMCGCSFYVRFIGSFKNGEMLFGNPNMVISYDSKYGTARKIEIDNLYGGEAAIYCESLVSLHSVTAVGRRKKREITRSLEGMTTKKRTRLTGFSFKKTSRDMVYPSEIINAQT